MQLQQCNAKQGGWPFAAVGKNISSFRLGRLEARQDHLKWYALIHELCLPNILAPVKGLIVLIFRITACEE